MTYVPIKQYMYMDGGSVGINHNIKDDVDVEILTKRKDGTLIYPGRYFYPKDKLLTKKVSTFRKGVPVRVIPIREMELL